MPKTRRAPTAAASRAPTLAQLYLLRSVDSVTQKPMSVKLGFSTRPIQRRQDELSAAREKFTSRLMLRQVTQAAKREKLAKVLLRESIPTKWYYANKSLEFMHHRASSAAQRTLTAVCGMDARTVHATLQAAQKRHTAHQALLASNMYEDGAKVVHVRSRKGQRPVPGTEALYFPRLKQVFHEGEFWEPAQYLQLCDEGTRDALGRLWCFATDKQPMQNLRGEGLGC